jgi:alpha-tubulin suppressor-like RCC1 family protein
MSVAACAALDAKRVSAATIAAGASHTCAITASLTPECWGSTEHGQLGNGVLAVGHSQPVPVQNLADIRDIAAGPEHACALTGAGTVYCWGEADYLGADQPTDSALPVQVFQAGAPPNLPLLGIVAIASGESQTCAIQSNGTVWCWRQGYATPVAGVPPGISAIAVGNTHVCVLDTGGAMYCWGSNSMGQLGDGTTTAHTTPIQVQNPDNNGPLANVSAIAAGYDFSCAVSAGIVYCWGGDSYGELGRGGHGDPFNSYPLPAAVRKANSAYMTDATAVAAGRYQGCALTSGKHVWCWGKNTEGEAGNGVLFDFSWTSNDASYAVPVVTDDGATVGSIIELASGSSSRHVCVRRTNPLGAIYCWGDNESGQAGAGALLGAVVEPQPVDFRNLPPSDQIVSISGTCGASASKHAYCWGYAFSATPASNLAASLLGTVPGIAQQLVAKPVRDPNNVGSLSNVQTLLSSSGTLNCASAVTGSGPYHSTLYCWGFNYYGEVGDGTTNNNRDLPVPVLGMDFPATDQPIRATSNGAGHTCAVTPLGTAACWGNNSHGAFGDGGTSYQNGTPVSVTGVGGSGLLGSLTGIAAADGFTCATDTNGRAFCWGANYSGQLGNGQSSGDQLTPVQVLGGGAAGDQPLDDVLAMASSNGAADHMCATRSMPNGGQAVYCWGRNSNGQLGTGLGMPDSAVPVLVTGLQGAPSDPAPIKVEVSGRRTCALVQLAPNDFTTREVRCWGHNGDGGIGDGTVNDRGTPTATVGLNLSPGSALVDITTADDMYGDDYGESCALANNGEARCWGIGDYGRLGNGQAAYYATAQLLRSFSADDEIFGDGSDP